MNIAHKEARKFAKASLVWFALMIGLTSFGAFAAHASVAKKPKAPEVYSATEAEEDAPAAAPKARPAILAPKRELRAAAAMPAPRRQAVGPAPSISYDPVPSDQSASLLKRLKLVELLIQRHGRAYDYRVHTVRELETVLAQMESALTPASRPAPRAAALAPLPPPSESPALPAAPTESDESAEMPGA